MSDPLHERIRRAQIQAGERVVVEHLEQLGLSKKKEKSTPPTDPLDTPLPCDVTIGAVTFHKGVKLSVLISSAQRWYNQAKSTLPESHVKLTYGTGMLSGDKI